MNSPFYRSYNIFKNYQLDEFYNTAELVRFLRQMPELIQTNEHHFSNSMDFGHYLSITLLCAAHHDDWFNESPESHATNLIVVVTSRLNNAHLFVEPLLHKICQFLNWQLIGDQESKDDIQLVIDKALEGFDEDDDDDEDEIKDDVEDEAEDKDETEDEAEIRNESDFGDENESDDDEENDDKNKNQPPSHS